MKVKALSKTLFDNNIISKDEVNKNIKELQNNELFLKEELIKLFQNDINLNTIEEIVTQLNFTN